MRKYIKTLIFLLISILIGAVVLSDPAKAQVDTEFLKCKNGDLDYLNLKAKRASACNGYKIKWDSSDWKVLVEDSKNIIENNLETLGIVEVKENNISLDYIYEEENNNSYLIIFNENMIELEDFNLWNRIFYSNPDSDEDVDNIVKYLDI